MRETPSDALPWRWVGCTGATVLALAAWLGAPGLLPVAVATVTLVGAAWLLREVRRGMAPAITTAMLALTVAITGAETLGLRQIAAGWSQWSADEQQSRADAIARSVGEVARSLQRAAQRAALDTAAVREIADGARGGGRTFGPPLTGRVESALLVYRFGQLIDRAGQLRTPIAPRGPDGVRLIEGAFHTSIVARASSPDGAVQAVAVALIASAPPADRFAQPLLATLASGADVSRTVVESPDSARVIPGSTVVVVPFDTARLARVRVLGYAEGETRLERQLRARARAGLPLVLAAVLLMITCWRRPVRTSQRMLAVGIVIAALALAPLNLLSNVSLLFDPAAYFAKRGGRLTGNIAALLATASLLLLALFAAMRDRVALRSRAGSAALLAVLAVVGPFLLRDLARGIALPAAGPSIALWIAWQLAIALVGVAILLAGAFAGATIVGTRRGVPPGLAPALAIASASLAPIVWQSPGGWPAWYPLLWVAAIAAYATARRGAAAITAAAIIAGCGAVTLVWGATVRERMELAQYDLSRLSAVDENAYRLLQRFADELAVDLRPVTDGRSLLRRYASSELALAGYPARLARWDTLTPRVPITDISLAPVNDTIGAQAIIAGIAREHRATEIQRVDDGPTTLLVAGIPSSDGIVTTIAVPPRTRLLPADAFAAITGVTGEPGAPPPYRLSLAAAPNPRTAPRPLAWRRRGDVMQGDGIAGGNSSGSARLAHVDIDLRSPGALLPRGALLVLLDVGVALFLWGASALADGALARWLRLRRTRLSRSYRVRLSATLLAFFVAPAAAFGAWAWYRLQDDDASARALVIREALRVAAGDVGRRPLASLASSAGAPLFLFRDMQLAEASDSLLDALAPLGRLLPASLVGDDAPRDDEFATRRIDIGRRSALVGFRRLPRMESNVTLVTPARGDEFALDLRREDLGVLVLFATALGAIAAVWSSGLAARSLARPVGALREAALALASGRGTPSLGLAPASEFAPVYRAFSRMAADLQSGRAALEAAQRRTEAVLQHVASGVLAFRGDGTVVIANPRAEALLGFVTRDGTATLASLPARFRPLGSRVQLFLQGTNDDESFDVTVPGRQLNARLTRLAGGAVLTVDDVTELASAQRVLAWGEMARQVAHEIKNPLTPIRLGVQHLRRAYRDGRSDFGSILDTNVSRVLSEIDHLDEIARAFSRYGTAPQDRTPPAPVDVVAITRDVLALEGLGEGGVTWQLDTSGLAASDTEAANARVVTNEGAAAMVLALRDEMREVLINLLENARLAGATHVTVAIFSEADTTRVDVRDNGGGIPSDVLPRVFEPHFSTRTSGSGLGLAISRRLIEGWGGNIALASAPGRTVVTIRLRNADAAALAG